MTDHSAPETPTSSGPVDHDGEPLPIKMLADRLLVAPVKEGDQVLFNPEDVFEVEVRGETFIILRERDVHAVAAQRLAEGSTGLYL